MTEINDELLKAIADGLEADGTFDAADRSHTAGLLADHEWTRARCFHVHTLHTAFLNGVSSADCWHKEYTLPPQFAEAANGIAFRIQARWPNEEVVRVSIFDYEQLLREWIALDPIILGWNDAPGSGICHRYSVTPATREFIDLSALTRNAAVWLMRESDRTEAFDRAFDEEWAAEHDGEKPFQDGPR